MSAESFIDTNVFVYQLERLDSRKADIAEHLIEEGIARGTACISFQVVQELLNTALRKVEIPFWLCYPAGRSHPGFNPCSSGSSFSARGEDPNAFLVDAVSILVLVDQAFQPEEAEVRGGGYFGVSILVLVDQAFQPHLVR